MIFSVYSIFQLDELTEIHQVTAHFDWIFNSKQMKKYHVDTLWPLVVVTDAASVQPHQFSYYYCCICQLNTSKLKPFETFKNIQLGVSTIGCSARQANIRG